MLLFSRGNAGTGGLFSQPLDEGGQTNGPRVTLAAGRTLSPSVVFGNGNWGAAWLTPGAVSAFDVNFVLLGENGAVERTAQLANNTGAQSSISLAYGNDTFGLGWSFADEAGEVESRLTIIAGDGTVQATPVVVGPAGTGSVTDVSWHEPEFFGIAWDDSNAGQQRLGGRVARLGPQRAVVAVLVDHKQRKVVLRLGRRLFAHLSADRRGSLLVQSGGLTPADGKLALWPPRGGPEILSLKASGPVRLLPEGGGLVVPESEGLSLRALPPRPPRRDLLPGSRDLVAFCPRAGRALLVRHWPDFRRSLELVEPGRAPRQLWIGPQAVVAAACAGSGDRVWMLLVEGLARPTLTLVELNRQGSLRKSRRLDAWELEPGAGLHHDPTGDRLLTVLRPRTTDAAPVPPPPQVVLIDAADLEPRPLRRTARQAVWLPPG
jgi:hypothetical protein